MYVVPKHLFEAYQNQGDRTVRDAVASINIRQLNNISDNVKASIQANDVTKGGQQRAPASGNPSAPGGGNLGGVALAAGGNFGQTHPSDAANFGQMRDGSQRAEEFLPPPPPPPTSHVNNDTPPTSLQALPVAGSSTQTDNTATETTGVQTITSINNATTQTDNDMRTVATQAELDNRNAAVQTDNVNAREGVTAINANANAKTVDASTQAAAEGISTGTATDSFWDFGNKKRNAVLANKKRSILTQTDFPTNVVSQDTQTDLSQAREVGVQVSPPPTPATRDEGVQVSPPQTHVVIPSTGQDAITQTNNTSRPRLSLASQMQIDVPPSYPIARRTGTSSAQTDPPTSIATTQPLGRSPRPSWTFKVPRFALGRSPVLANQQQRRDQLALTYQPSPTKKTPVQKRKKRVPVKYTPEMIRKVAERRKAAFTARRQPNLYEPVESGSTQQPAELPPITQSASTSTRDNTLPSTSFKVPRVTVRRRPVGLATQRQQQRSVQPSPKKKRERKATTRYNPEKITPEMIRRGVKRRKGERKTAFAARQLKLDEAVASGSTQQPAANPSATTRSRGVAAQPSWMPSKLAVKRTASVANMDTPLSKTKVGGKRGRSNKGEKRPVPSTFTTLQLHKRGKMG